MVGSGLFGRAELFKFMKAMNEAAGGPTDCMKQEMGQTR